MAITGSCTGIGYATAKAFIQAGASSVIILSRESTRSKQACEDLAKEIASSKTRILSRVCDINDDASVENFWKSLAEDGIFIDLLVLNTTDPTSGSMVPLLDNIPTLKSVFNANVFGNALMAAHFLNVPNDTKAPKALINVSTASAHCNPLPTQALYGSSKAAFACLLQHIAEEISHERCQILNFHPGVIFTAGFERVATEELKNFMVPDQGEYSTLQLRRASL